MIQYSHDQPKSEALSINMKKTKWQSVLSVEPKTFYDKFLTQYPPDIRITHPVVLFSHK